MKKTLQDIAGVPGRPPLRKESNFKSNHSTPADMSAGVLYFLSETKTTRFTGGSKKLLAMSKKEKPPVIE